MKIDVIGSSSAGNCIIINSNIMLDCGMPYIKVKDYLDNIKIIYISHIHQDHCKDSTIKKIAYEYPNIKFIVNQVNVNHLVELGVKKQNIFGLELEKWYELGLCKVRLDYLIHDKPNSSIKININGYKVFYAVDTASIDHIIAKSYDYYLIEANYFTDEELEEQIKIADEEGKFTHLKRVEHTHLSQLQAINWLQKNMGENSKYAFIHQHTEKEGKNNENI